LIENGDPRILAGIRAIVVFVGSKMVAWQPGLRSLGLRAAVAMFLAYGGYLYFYRAEGETNVWITLKAANAAGGVLSLTWIVFPILNFICSHIRLALAAFLGYCVYAAITTENFNTDMLPRIALEALIPVALTLVVAWIVHPIWDYVRALLPEPAQKKLDEHRSKGFRKALHKARKERAERRRVVEEYEDETEEAELPREAEIGPLELERVSRVQIDLQRRRDKARLQVELFYLSASADIGTRIDRNMFQDLLHRYLGDHVPVEDVEQNAQQLQLLLQQHQLMARDLPASPSLEDLTRKLIEEQQRALGLERHPQGNGSNGSHHSYGNGAAAREDDPNLVE
ncbi:MAG: hypothetical protein AB7K24_26825, partial [Gemmataceae bacterium]